MTKDTRTKCPSPISCPPGVRVYSVKVVFYQDSDSCQSEDDGQELTVATEDAGGGPYLVLTTDRWAIDSDEAGSFADMLRGVLDLVPKESP